MERSWKSIGQHTYEPCLLLSIHPAGDTAAQKEKLKAQRGRTAAGTKHPPPGEEETPGSGRPSSAGQALHEASAPRLFSPTLTHGLEKKPPGPPTWEKKSPQTLEKLPVSPSPREKSPSTILSGSPEKPRVSPLTHKSQSPGTAPGTAPDVRTSTQKGGEALSKQHTMKAEPADQRTEPPLSE